jgi:hypothetical protein
LITKVIVLKPAGFDSGGFFIELKYHEAGIDCGIIINYFVTNFYI